MKKYIFLVILFFLFVPSSQAETRYVVDFIRITLRTGPGVENKVLEMIESGQKLEVLESNPDWTKVKLENEKEGWVLSRFVTPNPPSRRLLAQLTEENTQGKERTSKLLTENEKLTGENQQLTLALESSKTKFDQLNNNYQALKADSGEFLDLKAKHETVSAQMDRQTRKAEILEKELNRLQLHKNIRWFLSGAGVFFVGFILGFSTKRQRKRSFLL